MDLRALEVGTIGQRIHLEIKSILDLYAIVFGEIPLG